MFDDGRIEFVAWVAEPTIHRAMPRRSKLLTAIRGWFG